MNVLLIKLSFAPVFTVLVLPLSLPGAEESDQPADITVIVSDHLQMRSTEEKNYFYFDQNVQVEATNLVVKSDRMEIIALRENEADDPDATVGEIGAIESIVATGNVEIYQAGRVAYAGRAEVLPREGKVVLSESPRVVDGETEIAGWQIVLNKGERQVIVFPNPDEQAAEADRERPTITLGGGALPDLGFDEDEAVEEGEGEEEEERDEEVVEEGEGEAVEG